MTHLEKQLEQARSVVRKLTFGTAEWETAMQKVRDLCEAVNNAAPKEEFCSVDSGFHRTRLSNGRMI